jgi:hypothetical protein
MSFKREKRGDCHGSRQPASTTTLALARTRSSRQRSSRGESGGTAAMPPPNAVLDQAAAHPLIRAMVEHAAGRTLRNATNSWQALPLVDAVRLAHIAGIACWNECAVVHTNYHGRRRCLPVEGRTHLEDKNSRAHLGRKLQAAVGEELFRFAQDAVARAPVAAPSVSTPVPACATGLVAQPAFMEPTVRTAGSARPPFAQPPVPSNLPRLLLPPPPPPPPPPPEEPVQVARAAQAAQAAVNVPVDAELLLWYAQPQPRTN